MVVPSPIASVASPLTLNSSCQKRAMQSFITVDWAYSRDQVDSSESDQGSDARAIEPSPTQIGGRGHSCQDWIVGSVQSAVGGVAAAIPSCSKGLLSTQVRLKSSEAIV